MNLRMVCLQYTSHCGIWADWTWWLKSKIEMTIMYFMFGRVKRTMFWKRTGVVEYSRKHWLRCGCPKMDNKILIRIKDSRDNSFASCRAFEATSFGSVPCLERALLPWRAENVCRNFCNNYCHQWLAMDSTTFSNSFWYIPNIYSLFSHFVW